VQPWRLASHGLAEAQDDAEFVRVDAEGEGVEGGDGHDHHDGEEDERAGETAAARHGLLNFVLTAPEQVFEVARRAATASPATTAPGHGRVLSVTSLATARCLPSGSCQVPVEGDDRYEGFRPG